jgi:microcystin-dependent protein
MRKQTVSIVVGSLFGATVLNAAMMMSCGDVSSKVADAQSADVAPDAAAPDAPAGSIIAFAGQTPPPGWLLCDGAQVSRATYAPLFGVIGTIYGQGDQVSTFNVPDLRGRTAIGAGQGNALSLRALAETGGEEQHTLTIAEMPTHSHRETGSNRLDVNTGGAIHVQDVDNTMFSPIVTQATGGGMAHNIMQPFIVLNYIIKT